jgi:hypothetical protein
LPMSDSSLSLVGWKFPFNPYFQKIPPKSPQLFGMNPSLISFYQKAGDLDSHVPPCLLTGNVRKNAL